MWMSALGQKQTFAVHKRMSALPPIATAKANFRKGPCLLYPQKRTCAVHQLRSALGIRTFAETEELWAFKIGLWANSRDLLDSVRANKAVGQQYDMLIFNLGMSEFYAASQQVRWDSFR